MPKEPTASQQAFKSFGQAYSKRKGEEYQALLEDAAAHSGAPVMPPTALRHPIFSLSRKLSVVGDSLPRGLNWPIKALSTFRGLAHPPWTT